jgi:hypothetical protein
MLPWGGRDALGPAFARTVCLDADVERPDVRYKGSESLRKLRLAHGNDRRGK